MAWLRKRPPGGMERLEVLGGVLAEYGQHVYICTCIARSKDTGSLYLNICTPLEKLTKEEWLKGEGRHDFGKKLMISIPVPDEEAARTITGALKEALSNLNKQFKGGEKGP